ncbi:MAG: hypothetical protein ACYCX6_01765 [Vulcanimicrobiaceae bacterium]
MAKHFDAELPVSGLAERGPAVLFGVWAPLCTRETGSRATEPRTLVDSLATLILDHDRGLLDHLISRGAVVGPKIVVAPEPATQDASAQLGTSRASVKLSTGSSDITIDGVH